MNNQLSLSALIDNTAFQATNACNNMWGQNLSCIQPLIQTYYPNYLSYYTSNKTEQAFKLVQKLLEKKLVKLTTIKDFIELTNEIISII